ncbi:MAG: S8/S53 family peptidase, partial [Actinomycetota bacterium]|nr:S8/S53 family peptidase [Actinomycetota bacterium]
MRNEQEEGQTGTPTPRRQSPRPLFPDLFSYDDPRTPEERAEDQRRVCRQVTNLTRRRQDDAFQSELIESLQRRRAGRDDADLLQFDVIPGRARGDLGTLVVSGQMLLRREVFEGDSGVRSALERSGFYPSSIDDCPELERTVQRLESRGIQSRRLENMVGLLRRQGVPASVNHIMPLGPVAKGLGGPENTAAARPFPKQRQAAAQQAAPAERTGTPPKRAAVAVIDTGIDKKEHRDDGWLASVSRDGNIDPLDDFPQRGGDGFLDFAAGHGNFAAGVVQQVFPDVDLRVYKALDSDGLGDELGVACAMVRAVKDGA